MGIIDGLVKSSQGAYTHEQAFYLEAGFAYSLLLMYYENEQYLERADNIKKSLRTPTGKK